MIFLHTSSPLLSRAPAKICYEDDDGAEKDDANFPTRMTFNHIFGMFLRNIKIGKEKFYACLETTATASMIHPRAPQTRVSFSLHVITFSFPPLPPSIFREPRQLCCYFWVHKPRKNRNNLNYFIHLFCEKCRARGELKIGQ